MTDVRSTSRPRGARSGEQGAGTVLVAVVILAIVAVSLVLVAAGRAAQERARIEGAADLSALAGGHAQRVSLPGCPVAEETAQANGAVLEECRVAGDEVEFVVTVVVSRQITWGLWTQRLQARANAGVMTGAPA